MTDLPKREIGRTGLQVTMLGYGAMELRGAPRGREVTEAQAETILHAVLDAGINYIDTSIDYGLSEERIGRYIASRRSEYYLASKCGCAVGATPAPRGQRNPHVFTRDNIVAGVEQTLGRVKTDHLDVVQFHASPSKQALEEHDALEALLSLKRAGKVRFIGMSATLPHLADHIAMGVFDVFQIPYSAVEREHEAIITSAAESGAGIVIRGGAAKGAPSGGWRGRDAMGALAEGAARPLARGHDPDGVHSPVHLHPPRTWPRTSWGRSTRPISTTTALPCYKGRSHRHCVPRSNVASLPRAPHRR